MESKNPFVAGVVVLFNPTVEVLENIGSYIDQLAHLYVVDNSTAIDTAIKERIGKLAQVSYIDNNGNKGIAHALNRGAERAIETGYQFLLTMDQDTPLTVDYVKTLASGFRNEKEDKIGLMTPRYTDIRTGGARYERVLIAMTSGSILNLSVYKKLGPFLEELFIDHVDHEYCIRLKANDHYVMQDNDLPIRHKPGKRRQVGLLGKTSRFSSQSVTRLYYFCRNGFYVSDMYRNTVPEFRVLFMSLLRKTIVKAALEPDTFARWGILRKGYRDYRAGHMGELKTND